MTGYEDDVAEEALEASLVYSRLYLSTWRANHGISRWTD